MTWHHGQETESAFGGRSSGDPRADLALVEDLPETFHGLGIGPFVHL